jgi:hypothetical protein
MFVGDGQNRIIRRRSGEMHADGIKQRKDLERRRFHAAQQRFRRHDDATPA